jgi:hypothetical protein
MLKLHERFIINEQGKKTDAVVPYSEWKKIAAILEEYDDILAYDKAKAKSSGTISFKEALKKL